MMRAKNSMLILLTACMVLGGSCAQAVVTVTPDNMQGWSIETNAGGWGALCPWGPSTYENMNIADNKWSTGPFPFNGKGSFYATCDYFKGAFIGTEPVVDWTPSTVWLGLDQWNGSSVAGRTLGSITAMDYYSFVSKVPQRWAGSSGGGEVEFWSKNNYWNTWQQPILLELTAEIPDKMERRQFWHRPWGYNYTGDDGMQQKGYWQKLNCLKPGAVSSSKWYSPICGDVTVKPDAGEIVSVNWDLLMTSSLNTVFAGSTQTATFSKWTLVETSNDPYPTGWKSPGYSDGTFPKSAPDTKYANGYPPTDPIGHPNCNGTGKAINFHVGARMTATTPLWNQGDTQEIRWSNNTYGFRGQVDYFTLGFNATSVTYDFEPSVSEKPVRVVGANIKSLGRQTAEQYLNLAPIVQGAYLFNPVKGAPNSHTGSTEMTQKKFLCKVFGKVTRVKQGAWNNDFRQWTNSYFLIEDGSKLVYKDTGVTPNPLLSAPIWVFLPPYQDQLRVYVGDYVAVYGFVEPMRWKNVGTPLIMWSQQEHVTEMNML